MKPYEKLKRLAFYFAAIVLTIAVLTLIGWQFDIQFLKRPIPHLVAMNPTTAVVFAIISISFFFLNGTPSLKLFGQLLAWIVGIIGSFRVADLLFDFPLDVDDILFHSKMTLDKEGISVRMPSNTAINFVLLSGSLLLCSVSAKIYQYLQQAILLVVSLLSLFSIFGYIYRIPEFYGALPYFPMAVHSALGFFLSALSILFIQSDQGLMRTFTREEEGASLGRLFIPGSLFITIILGYLRMWGHWKEIFSLEFGVALLVLSIAIIFVALTWFYADMLNRRDRKRRIVEEESAQLNKQLQVVNEEMASLNEELSASNEELQASNDQLHEINIKLKDANETIARQTTLIIRQKDEQLNRVLESTNHIIWSYDLTGKGEDYVSRSVERLTGGRVETFLSDKTSWIKLLHMDDHIAWEDSQKQLFGKDSVKGTYRVIDFRGQLYWMNIEQSIIRDINGAPQRQEGIATDITAVKKAEKAAADERNLLRSLIDNLPDYIYIKDTQSRHVINNKANIALLGAESEEETLNKSLIDYLGNDAEPYLEDDRYVFTTGNAIINKEEKMLTAEREEITLLTTKVPIRDENGKVTRLVGISRDITHFREQEEKIKSYQRNLDILFSNTIEEILLLDRDGKVVLFNNALDRFITNATGKHPQVGNYLWDTTIPERSEESRKLFNKALAGNLVVVEVPFVLHGSKVVHQLRYQPFIVNGEAKYVSIISWDVTEAKQKEENLKISEANLKAIFDNTETAFSLLDENYRFIAFNNASFKNIFIETHRELKLNTSITDYLPEARKAFFLKMIEKVRMDGKVRYERQIGEGSEKRWIDVSITPIKGERDVILGYCISAHDISAIHHVQTEVHEREERFRAMIESSDDIFAIVNHQMENIYISPNCERILGYSEKELIGKSNSSLVHPDDYNQARRDTDILQQKPEGTPLHILRRLKHKDGRWLWMEGTAINLFNKPGIKGRVLVFRDVTEKKQRENRILELNHSLADFQNAIYRSSIVSRADQKGIITYVNENFVKISGYPEQELIGQNHRIINSGFHPKRFWITMWKTISSGKTWREEVKNKAKDGSYYWVDTFIMPFLDDKGVVQEYLSIRNDITQRNKALEELRQSRYFLEKAEEVASIGYWILDEQMKFTWSKETHKIYGLSEGDFDGRHDSILALIHPDDRPQVKSALTEALAGGSTYNVDFRILRPDRSQRWLHEQAELDETIAGEKIWVGITQEITNRKHIEQVLREFNERYEILSKATNDAIWDWDVKLGMVTWNHGLQSIFGYPEGKTNFSSDWWRQRFHEEDHDRVRLEIAKTFDERQTNWSSTYRYRCADGSYKFVHDRAYVIYDDEDPVRMIGAMQDITEQMRAMEEIKKLSFVVSKTDNAIMITNAEGVIEWVNDGFIKLTEYSLEEVLGRKSNFLQGPESDPHTVKRVREKLQRRESLSEEIIHYTKSGRKYWIKLDITPVFNNEGILKNFISIQTDITEQKEFSSTITTIARELASLIENANVPIFGVDRDGYINEWNRVASELTGFMRNELFGRKWVDEFVDPHYRHAARDMVAKVFLGNSVANFELPILTKGRKRLILLLSASPGKVVDEVVTGIIIVAQNITELIEYRQNLERMVEERTRELNEALLKEKELVEMKSKFVSIASHEFRTPLSTISLATGFVRRYKTKIKPEEIDNKLDNIDKQVNYMTHLLDDVLLIGKADAGKIQTNITALEIRPFFEKLISEVAATAGKTHWIIMSDKKLSIEMIHTDEKLMRNIMINLLTNAIKFSPLGDSVDLDLSGDAERLTIIVRDRGIGIPEEDLKKLFQPFYRASNASTIQGTGLGLSILKKAVDLLGGVVVVKSAVGKGTEISVTLPTLYE